MDDKWVEVERKMAEMKIAGYSSMGEFTPEEHLAHLEEIARMRALRAAAAAPGVSPPADASPTESSEG